MLKRILILLAMLALFAFPAAAENKLEETILFSGKATATAAWSTAVEIGTSANNGAFDTSLMGRGGYFTVMYEGTERGVTLSMTDAAGETVATVAPPASTRREGTAYVSTFTFEQCEIQYGSRDFSQIAAIRVGTPAVVHKNGLKVQQVSWHGYPQDPDGVTIFSGEASSNAKDANIQFIFTAHVGGGWDASRINEGSAFRVTYTGPKNGIYLALSSHSGARQWAKLEANEVLDAGNGSWSALFNYESIARAWGTDFARLDQVTVYSSTAQKTTVSRIVYIPGEGEPVDTSDGRWDRQDTGIALIGDSICQNAMLIYHDWNRILGREDCSNYGIGGQTTLECRARIDELCNRHYAQVVFICGINDIGHQYSDAEIVANYDAMIRALQASNPDIQVAIVSVLPTTEAFYYGMQNRIVRLNAALEELAAKTNGVAFVNCYDDFLDAERGYAKPELLSDGLHPNAAGYAVMAERLAGALIPEEE